MLERLVIQGTQHGSAKAVVPPGPNYEIIYLTTSDGIRIAAQYGPALAMDGVALTDHKTRPGLIYCYPGGGTMRWSESQFDGFRRLGLNVIMPEYPGFGMSEGASSEQGCYSAAAAAYDYMEARASVPAAKILAAGWSMGGATVLNLAVQRRPDGLILLGTFTTIDDAVRQFIGRGRWRSWFAERIISRLRSRLVLDNLRRMADIHCPILIICGSRDEFISTEMSNRLAANAAGPVSTVWIEGCRHFNLFKKGSERIFGAIANWLSDLG